MISSLLLAADLIDAVANPYRTAEEHEIGLARLASLAQHGARIDTRELRNATAADVELLPAHIWRWALNEEKTSSHEIEVSRQLPKEEVIEQIYWSDTDRISRLLLAEAVLTHPDAERQFQSFETARNPVRLDDLPWIWPHQSLVELIQGHKGDRPAGTYEANLAELGMILLQIGTPASLAFAGSVIRALHDDRIFEHSLLAYVEQYVASLGDEDLAVRLGLDRPRDIFR